MGKSERKTSKPAVLHGMKDKAVFLDRDGTIIEDMDFLSDPAGIRFIEGAVEALEGLERSGFRLVLISNQSGVARGFFTEETVAAIHGRMSEILGEHGVVFSAVYYCPHLPDAPVEKYRLNCDCRKPKTGMIRRAVEELGVDPTRSFFVGDKASDLQAGRTAGCRTVLVLTGKGGGTKEALSADFAPDFIARDIGEAACWILKRNPGFITSHLGGAEDTEGGLIHE